MSVVFCVKLLSFGWSLTSESLHKYTTRHFWHIAQLQFTYDLHVLNLLTFTVLEKFTPHDTKCFKRIHQVWRRYDRPL